MMQNFFLKLQFGNWFQSEIIYHISITNQLTFSQKSKVFLMNAGLFLSKSSGSNVKFQRLKVKFVASPSGKEKSKKITTTITTTQILS